LTPAGIEQVSRKSSPDEFDDETEMKKMPQTKTLLAPKVRYNEINLHAVVEPYLLYVIRLQGINIIYMGMEWNRLFIYLVILGFEFQELPRAEVVLMHFNSKYFCKRTVHRQRQDVRNSETSCSAPRS